MTAVNVFWVCVLSSLIFLSVPSRAQERYFAAEIPVKSQTRNERAAAAESALLEVLVRVSGSEVIRDNRIVFSRKKSALSLVELYQYMELEDPLKQQQGYVASLNLQFSERLVKQLLRDAGACFWSVNRPKTLVWLVEDSVDYGKQLLAYNPDSPAFLALQKEASYRGVPLIFPLMDFEDQTNLGAGLAWALDEEAIRAASSRYQADTIVVGKLTRTSLGELWSNWMYLYANGNRLLDLRSADIAEIGPGVVGPLADTLSQQFAVCSSSEDSDAYFLQVHGIGSFASYRGVVETLESIDAISQLSIDKVEQDTISLRLESEASAEQLERLIRLTRKLYADASNEPSSLQWGAPSRGSKQNPWHYSWRR
jgi:hypothetical protein